MKQYAHISEPSKATHEVTFIDNRRHVDCEFIVRSITSGSEATYSPEEFEECVKEYNLVECEDIKED